MLPINAAAEIANGAYSHTPASHIVTTTTPPSALDAYDEDETEDEDMIGGTIYDSPKREAVDQKPPPTENGSDAPASLSPVPPVKHEFPPRTAAATVSSKGNRIMSEDEESSADIDANGEVDEDQGRDELSEGDDEDEDEVAQQEYKDSADEEDYEDDDEDDIDLEEMDDDEDEDFDLGGKKSKRKGKAAKKNGSGNERASKKAREGSSSSKCTSSSYQRVVLRGHPNDACHPVQVPARFESKISSRNESSDEEYGQELARRTHRKADHPSIAGIKRRRQGTTETNDDSDAYRAMSSRTGKAIDYNEKAVDYGLESDEVEEEAPRPKANAYYNSGEPFGCFF